MNAKKKMTFTIWRNDKEDDVESILSFESEMNNIYSENDKSTIDSDIE